MRCTKHQGEVQEKMQPWNTFARDSAKIVDVTSQNMAMLKLTMSTCSRLNLAFRERALLTSLFF